MKRDKADHTIIKKQEKRFCMSACYTSLVRNSICLYKLEDNKHSKKQLKTLMTMLLLESNREKQNSI